MQAVPKLSEPDATFDLLYLVKGLKNRSLSQDNIKELAMGLCSYAKNIILLAIDKVDTKQGLSSKDDIQGSLTIAAALLELSEFAVAESEITHE